MRVFSRIVAGPGDRNVTETVRANERRSRVQGVSGGDITREEMAGYRGKKGCEKECGVDCVVHTSLPYSNLVDVAKIEVKRGGQVRRAKLYFLRDRTGKSTRLKERRREEEE